MGTAASEDHDSPLFVGGPCTDITLDGDPGPVIVIPYDRVYEWLERFAAGDWAPCFVEVPFLLHEEETDEWSVELGLLRLDKVLMASPWVPKPSEAEATGIVIGRARRDHPEHFAPGLLSLAARAAAGWTRP